MQFFRVQFLQHLKAYKGIFPQQIYFVLQSRQEGITQLTPLCQVTVDIVITAIDLILFEFLVIREESEEVLRQEMDRFNEVLLHREELVREDLQHRLYKLETELQVSNSPVQSKMQYVQISNTLDTSIKHPVSGQSTLMHGKRLHGHNYR